MKIGSLVGWTTSDLNTGRGITIAEPTADGHVMVAVLSDGEKHHVIYCALTWLTLLEEPELAHAPADEGTPHA